MNGPPTFQGATDDVQAVDNFIADFTTYCLAHRLNAPADRIALFDSCVRNPAARDYNQVVINGMTFPPALAANATPAQIAEDLLARLDVRFAWLRNEYQGPRQQQAIRNLIPTVFQNELEHPRNFHARLVDLFERSGYADET